MAKKSRTRAATERHQKEAKQNRNRTTVLLVVAILIVTGVIIGFSQLSRSVGPEVIRGEPYFHNCSNSELRVYNHNVKVFNLGSEEFNRFGGLVSPYIWSEGIDRVKILSYKNEWVDPFVTPQERVNTYWSFGTDKNIIGTLWTTHYTPVNTSRFYDENLSYNEGYVFVFAKENEGTEIAICALEKDSLFAIVYQILGEDHFYTFIDGIAFLAIVDEDMSDLWNRIDGVHVNPNLKYSTETEVTDFTFQGRPASTYLTREQLDFLKWQSEKGMVVGDGTEIQDIINLIYEYLPETGEPLFLD